MSSTPVQSGIAVDERRFLAGTNGRVLGALIGVYLLWGSTYLAIRYAVQTIPPFYMAGARFLIAGLVLYVFFRLRGAPRPSRVEWRNSALVGGLLLVGGNGIVSIAEKSVASHLAALLIATVPLWATIFSRIWGYRPTRLEVLGVLLGLAGVAILSRGTSLHTNVLGTVLLLVAAMSWALGTVWSPHLALPRGMMASATEQICGGCILLVGGILRGERLHAMPSITSLEGIAYLIVFGSIIAFSCYAYLLQRVRPAIATSYAYVNPVVAVFLGVGLAGEQVTKSGFLALVVIVVAVTLVVLGHARA